MNTSFFKSLQKKLSASESVFGEINLKTGERAFSALPREGIIGDMYYESFAAPKALILCGAGHVSAALCPIAAMCGFDVCVIDDRPELVTRERFPLASRLVLQGFQSALLNEQGTYFAVLTRGHMHDRQCLEIILKKQFDYCGMIGSRKKNAAVFAELIKSGFSAGDTSRVAAPIGLDIKAETPQEIAVSIAAQLISVRAEAQGTEGFDSEVLSALCGERAEAMATVCETAGSAPRKRGSRMALLKNGEISGSIGGGAAEAKTIELLKGLNHGDKPFIIEINMDNASAAAEGLICGGKVKILLEKI